MLVLVLLNGAPRLATFDAYCLCSCEGFVKFFMVCQAESSRFNRKSFGDGGVRSDEPIFFRADHTLIRITRKQNSPSPPPCPRHRSSTRARARRESACNFPNAPPPTPHTARLVPTISPARRCDPRVTAPRRFARAAQPRMEARCRALRPHIQLHRSRSHPRRSARVVARAPPKSSMLIGFNLAPQCDKILPISDAQRKTVSAE